MDIQPLHRWGLTPKEAIALQKSLAEKVIHNRPVDADAVRLVGGVDVSVKNDISRAAVVVMAWPEMTIIETRRAAMPTPFPYVPGLLSFREGPVLIKTFDQLETIPDVFIFDGMGRIHPRKLGIASHIGLWLNRPTIGCGKSHLVGDYDPPGPAKGDYSVLTYQGERLGVVLRTRDHVKPVYISPGHLIDIESAMAITLRCTPKYRLPEPVRAAHNAAGL